MALVEIPAVEPDDVATLDDGDTAAPRRKRRTLAVVAAVVAVAVLVAGAGWVVSVARADTAAKTEAFLAEAAASSAQWSTTRDELVGAIEHASALLDESKDRVTDPAALDNLATAIEEATTLIGHPRVYGDAVGVSGDGGLSVPLATAGLREARQAAADAAAAVDEQQHVADELAAAVVDVEDSRAVFELAAAAAAADAARSELAAAMTAGEDVMTATEGQVQDNAVRQALRDALDAAALVRDAQVDVDDLDALTAAAAALVAEKGKVEAGARSVNEAHDAWVQAENNRKAAASTPAPKATTPAAPRSKDKPVEDKPVEAQPEPQEPAAPASPDAGNGMTDDEYWDRVTGGHDTVCFEGEREWLC